MGRSRSPPRKSAQDIRRDDGKHKREPLAAETESEKREKSFARIATESEQWGKSSARAKTEHGLIEEEASSSQFIRHADDPTINQRQKKGLRWDDPARYFVESMKVERAKYRAPPNRFDLRPGRHWDGVDRSNGFEKRLFQERANKLARQEHAHKHDFEDL